MSLGKKFLVGHQDYREDDILTMNLTTYSTQQQSNSNPTNKSIFLEVSPQNPTCTLG
jgi:hypothetical protein